MRTYHITLELDETVSLAIWDGETGEEKSTRYASSAEAVRELCIDAGLPYNGELWFVSGVEGMSATVMHIATETQRYVKRVMMIVICATVAAVLLAPMIVYVW